MSGPQTKQARRLARERAFDQHAEPVLRNPDAYHPLRVARVRRFLTMKELGRLSYLHSDTIGRIERGETPPNRMTRMRVANALRLAVEDLFR